MTPFQKAAAQLKSAARKADDNIYGSSSHPILISPSIKSDADAAVEEFQTKLAMRLKKEETPGSDTFQSSQDSDEEMVNAQDAGPSTASRWPVPIYNISEPNPTLTLPNDYHFRTTETGYPMFNGSHSNPTDRNHMSAEQRAMEQRISSFIDRWTKTYDSIGDDTVSRVEGMFQLRLECQVRGLVTYGSKEMLVTRLVDRALRDAAKGWSEVEDSVGRIRYDSAPH